jgi:hypothetical protein
VIFSDGISQAGMGRGLVNGWESLGVADYLTRQVLPENIEPGEIPKEILDQAKKYWGPKNGDDCSCIYIRCRRGITVNVLSGPPKDKSKDKGFVHRFLSAEGIKIVCGGSSAKIVSREAGEPLEILESGDSLTPPKYQIKGITLVTEGVVTLNQVNNILHEDIPDLGDLASSVAELADFLKIADRVVFYSGTAENLGSKHLEFRLQGIMPRKRIIPVLVQKLEKEGKLVLIHNF